MLQASFYDDFGNSLNGELGWGISSLNPIPYITDKAGDVKDATVTAAKKSYSGVKTAGQYVVDKACASTRDPYIQAAMIASAAVPSGYTQAAAAGYAATGAACALLYPPGAPPMPPVPGGGTAALTQAYPMMFAKANFSVFKPKAPAAPALPSGTIAAFDAKRGGYRVAIPAGLSGPALFTEVGVQATKPAGAQLVDLKTFESETGATPWFKKPVVLGGIGLGVLALVAGGYAITR